MEEKKDLNVSIKVEGTEEAAHGFRVFVMFAIPLLLILAASGLVGAWIEFNLGQHQIKQANREESAQQRADNRVGAKELPKAPIKLVMASRLGCLKFDSGYLDNGSVTAYIKNTCHDQVHYYEVHMAGIAPDGTIVSGCYTNRFPDIGPGEKVEIVLGSNCYGDVWSLDDRIVTIRTTITGSE